jgi:hypothetical protein
MFSRSAVLIAKLKLKLIYDRQSVGQSVLVSGTHLGPVTNFSFSLKFPLDNCVCYFVAPSLTRGRVCNLLFSCFWALPEHSWAEVPQYSRPYFTVLSETPPTWRARFPYLYPPRNRMAQLYPWALGLSPHLLFYKPMPDIISTASIVICIFCVFCYIVLSCGDVRNHSKMLIMYVM